MILPHNTIILVADGARMLLLRNVGDAIAPELQVIEHRQYEGLPNREIVTDAPGVTFSSSSARRSAYDEGDAHASEEARFLTAASEALAAAADSGTGPIIVAAAPTALGILRQAYSAATKEKLIAELDKDYSGMPIGEITRRLIEH